MTAPHPAGDGNWRPSQEVLLAWDTHADEMAARARVWAAEPGGMAPAPLIPRIMARVLVSGQEVETLVDAFPPGAAHAREAWERAVREARELIRLVVRARRTDDARDWEVAHVCSMAALSAEDAAAALDQRALLAQPGL